VKHFEFQTYVNDDATVTIPTEVISQIERNRPVRVIVVVQDSAEDQEWSELTATQFLQGYADTDAIYDDVSAG
jgi:hypothetical protein